MSVSICFLYHFSFTSNYRQGFYSILYFQRIVLLKKTQVSGPAILCYGWENKGPERYKRQAKSSSDTAEELEVGTLPIKPTVSLS